LKPPSKGFPTLGIARRRKKMGQKTAQSFFGQQKEALQDARDFLGRQFDPLSRDSGFPWAAKKRLTRASRSPWAAPMTPFPRLGQTQNRKEGIRPKR
jgi:hypothetical protein